MYIESRREPAAPETSPPVKAEKTMMRSRTGRRSGGLYERDVRRRRVKMAVNKIIGPKIIRPKLSCGRSSTAREFVGNPSSGWLNILLLLPEGCKGAAAVLRAARLMAQGHWAFLQQSRRAAFHSTCTGPTTRKSRVYDDGRGI